MSDANHGHPLESLSSYLDDELPVDERATIDRHLALCPDCREHLEVLRCLARAVAEEAVPPPPIDLEARVLRRLDAVSVVPLRRRRFVVPATVAATIAAVSLVAVVTWKQGGGALAPRPERGTEPTETTRLRDKVAVNAPAADREPPLPSAPPQASPRVRVDAGVSVPAGGLTDAVKKEKADDALAEKPAAKVAAAAQVAPEVTESKDEKSLGAFGRVAGAAPAAAVGGRASTARNELDAQPAPCASPAEESAVVAVWDVPDLAVAVRELEALAVSLGGRLDRPGAAPDATFAAVIPRERYDRFVAAAGDMGITGLEGEAAGTSTECIRQRIALRQVAER
jgi:hypothetical protein